MRLPDFGYPQTNDKVDVGWYACMQCEENNAEEQTTIYIQKPSKLPKCENCGITYWMKLQVSETVSFLLQESAL